MGRRGWSPRSQEALGEMRWERQTENLQGLVDSGRIWILILHKQMALQCSKQLSYMIRFVFERVTLMTRRTAD